MPTGVTPGPATTDMRPGGTRHPERSPHPGYTLEPPRRPRPIVIVGAGDIVRDAHLPAYRKAGYPVAALVDPATDKARSLAGEFGVGTVHRTVEEAIADFGADVVYDVATPPSAQPAIVGALPSGAGVLLQKPLGMSLAEGEVVARICHERGLVAAVNLQLRFSPDVAAARALVASGAIGELYDLEVRVATRTPWELFPYVRDLERLELPMHSIHYIDLVRSFLGDPTGVEAVTVPRPDSDLASTRSTVIMRFGDRPLRAVVSTNHDHRFGAHHEESHIAWEGTKGAVRARLGVLVDYPRGGSDLLEYVLDDEPEAGWQPVPVDGGWFPDAFIGSMGVLQRYLEGSIPSLPTSVDDVLRTMAVIETAHGSSDGGGTPPPYPVRSDLGGR